MRLRRTKNSFKKEFKYLKSQINKTRQSEVYLREQMTKLEQKNSQLAKLNMELNAKLVKMNNNDITGIVKLSAGSSTGTLRDLQVVGFDRVSRYTPSVLFRLTNHIC